MPWCCRVSFLKQLRQFTLTCKPLAISLLDSCPDCFSLAPVPAIVPKAIEFHTTFSVSTYFGNLCAENVPGVKW